MDTKPYVQYLGGSETCSIGARVPRIGHLEYLKSWRTTSIDSRLPSCATNNTVAECAQYIFEDSFTRTSSKIHSVPTGSNELTPSFRCLAELARRDDTGAPLAFGLSALAKEECCKLAADRNKFVHWWLLLKCEMKMAFNPLTFHSDTHRLDRRFHLQ